VYGFPSTAIFAFQSSLHNGVNQGDEKYKKKRTDVHEENFENCRDAFYLERFENPPLWVVDNYLCWWHSGCPK
jgi:hypothetical protein